MGHFTRIFMAACLLTSAGAMYSSTAGAESRLQEAAVGSKKCVKLTDSCYGGYYEGGVDCWPLSPCQEVGDCIIT